MKNLPNVEKIENDFRLQQYRNLENWDKLFSILTKRYKKLQVFLQDMAGLLWHIDSAVGVQLDNIGHILGIPRRFRIDDYVYKQIIHDGIAQNYSGTFPEIEQFLIQHTADSELEIIQEHPFGSLVCFTPNGIEADTARLGIILAAGILPLVGNYFQLIDDENDVLQFVDGSVWLLAKENVHNDEINFHIAFIFAGGIPSNFFISVNNYNGREKQKTFILYNLNSDIKWKFISIDMDFQDKEGTFEIQDGIFEYEIEINLTPTPDVHSILMVHDASLQKQVFIIQKE